MYGGLSERTYYVFEDTKRKHGLLDQRQSFLLLAQQAT